MNKTHNQGGSFHYPATAPSILTSLRALVPQRPADFTEALRIAEQQAQRFLQRVGLSGVNGAITDDVLLDLPRICIEFVEVMPTSGCSFWDNDRKSWIIQVNASEPVTRQRFTMFHEYKHIVDHGRADLLYGSSTAAGKRAEQAADFFAGCVLMPRPLVKRAFCRGIQTIQGLAQWFDVSEVAAQVRLAQIGLTDEPPRCATGRSSRTGYRRSSPRAATVKLLPHIKFRQQSVERSVVLEAV